jgi:hypothetical protein
MQFTGSSCKVQAAGLQLKLLDGFIKYIHTAPLICISSRLLQIRKSQQLQASWKIIILN